VITRLITESVGSSGRLRNSDLLPAASIPILIELVVPSADVVSDLDEGTTTVTIDKFVSFGFTGGGSEVRYAAAEDVPIGMMVRPVPKISGGGVEWLACEGLASFDTDSIVSPVLTLVSAVEIISR